ncbi:hypothetical protein BJX70DRAFT_399937 [Aspergillus crustosus]
MATSQPSTWQWFLTLFEPAMILSWAMSCYIKVNARTILQGNILAPFLHAQRLRDEAFGEFWIAFSSSREAANKNASPTPPSPNPTPDTPQTPFQQQSPSEEKTTHPKMPPSDLIPSILAHAHGTVLDVGPGTAAQMPLLATPRIKAVYGAEPCGALHEVIRERMKREGMQGRYFILNCGVGDGTGTGTGGFEGELERVGLMPPVSSQGSGKGKDKGKDSEYGTGIFDTIITIRVLCSVPSLPTTTSHLQRLLKPGGKLLVVEHVVNPWRTPKGSRLARLFQSLYHILGWRWVMGDCCLDRDTEGVLRGLQWESVETDRFFEDGCMPHFAGVFVKKG